MNLAWYDVRSSMGILRVLIGLILAGTFLKKNFEH